MPKTSILISDDDREFALKVGDNVSDGIRYCINYVRNFNTFKQELANMLGSLPTQPIAIPAIDGGQLSENQRAKIFEMMEDDE